MARSPVMAAALCFHQRGWVTGPPHSPSWTNTRAKAAVNLTEAATEAAATSSSSSSSATVTATATPRPPPPPPASAQFPPSPPANLVSGSRRGAAIGQRKAPRHNGAGRRRWACQRWGFPLSSLPPATDKVRAPGRRWRARSGAGWAPQGARAPGAGFAQVGRSGTSLALVGGAEPTQVVEEEDAGRGRSRWGWPNRCGYLSVPHLRAGLAGSRLGQRWVTASQLPRPPPQRGCPLSTQRSGRCTWVWVLRRCESRVLVFQGKVSPLGN